MHRHPLKHPLRHNSLRRNKIKALGALFSIIDQSSDDNSSGNDYYI